MCAVDENRVQECFWWRLLVRSEKGAREIGKKERKERDNGDLVVIK